MQNWMVECCSKNDVTKPDEWKVRFVKNDQQLALAISEMNSIWLYVFFISTPNIQNRYFTCSIQLCEFRRQFQKHFDFSSIMKYLHIIIYILQYLLYIINIIFTHSVKLNLRNKTRKIEISKQTNNRQHTFSSLSRGTKC